MRAARQERRSSRKINLNARQNTFVFLKKKCLEIGFSWNAAKHDFMSNACVSACLFKTHGVLLLGSFI